MVYRQAGDRSLLEGFLETFSQFFAATLEDVSVDQQGVRLVVAVHDRTLIVFALRFLTCRPQQKQMEGRAM